MTKESGIQEEDDVCSRDTTDERRIDGGSTKEVCPSDITSDMGGGSRTS